MLTIHRRGWSTEKGRTKQQYGSQPGLEVLDSTELRPGGGFIGNYGIATFSGGRLTAAHITDTYLLDKDNLTAGHTIPSMYHLVVCCRRRMDGSHAPRIRPLGAWYGLAFSRSPMVRPILLPLSGRYSARPRSMQRG